jgi:alkylation response protein AidB-like acyl-CoA dehydrogenase
VQVKDVRGMATRGYKAKEEYILNGNKQFIINGEVIGGS